MKKQIERKFIEVFGEGGLIYASAPGRANLIGEHIDYQGGHVMPIAVDRFIHGFGRKKNNGKISLFSFNYGERFDTDTDKIEYQEKQAWPNYVLGVISEFNKSGYSFPGMDIAFGGDVPEASGLSSSAAVEIAMAVLLCRIFGIEMHPVELVKLARRAENEFVGVSCGIMDQFAIHLSRKGSALLLNCNSLEFSHVPLELGPYAFLLVDTKKKRKLSSSVYNERVVSVQEALETVKKYEPVRFITDVENIFAYREKLSEETFKRVLHIAEENRRVKESAEDLEAGNIEGFGQKMYQSHESLRSLYEVSCEELDFIVSFSGRFSGVKGARLTGAGMGGCCIVLIQKEAVERFKNSLGPLYRKRFGIAPGFYGVEPVNGAFHM